MKLSDKYTVERGAVYLTGIQALVRLPLDQMRRDRQAGLNTGTFISGYEGSPLGGYDLTLARTRTLLEQYNIHFNPGVNEELAATSVMGSQIIDVLGTPKVDGVLGIWYGKGPGVDRSGDIFRHANLAGTTGKHAAALVLAGDDHACKSSTIPHQSDFSLMNVGIPFFYPGNVQEIIDYGLLAVALSRYSGAWVGMKLVTDICDGGGTVIVDPDMPRAVLPEGYAKHTDARLVPPVTLGLEVEVNIRRLAATLDFVHANRVNTWHGARAGAWLGIASAGKPYYDLIQALRDLGLDEPKLRSLGIRVAKFGITWPLEPRFAADFADGLEHLVVIEEKRSFLEMHLRNALYSLPQRPTISGKQDESGAPLFPPTGELDPDKIARAIGAMIARRHRVDSVSERLKRIVEAAERPKEATTLVRAANFCSGCPHNRSTLLLDGQAAGGGIGCHTMAVRLGDPNRSFSFLTQMGGEGTPWIGMAPFVERGHVFQNIGDGTFFHSGQLAVEACIAAGVNITYKILYNGHVSMTGGQEAVGALPVPALTRKLEAEGVRKTVVLAEDTTKYAAISLAANAELRDRSELSRTLAEMETISGVSVIIYDQECAAEKRRSRSRGKTAEPVLRLMINEEVCEGCGDCVKQSNCMSLNPVPTPFGQKMRIHQSSCNKDYSCALGDCPSFVTVKIKAGTGIKKKPLPALPTADVPPPRDVASVDRGYRIVMPGIGGTGVVTINALIATAAWIDGLSAITLDQTGTAQKGGAVVSHILLSREPLGAPTRTNTGNADLIIGFDLIGASNPENLKVAAPDRTVAVLNTNFIPTVDSIRSRTILSGGERVADTVNRATRPGRNIFVDASRIAEGLFGTHMAVNIFMLGITWQAGLVPVSLTALEQAMELNGAGADKNLLVFQWGRKYYEDAGWVESFLPASADKGPRVDVDFAAELRGYQNDAYAQAYTDFIDDIGRRAPALKDTVARFLYKLMAYKDEYEVARLLTKPEFEQQARDSWEAVESISYNLHPPLLRSFGVQRKLKLGPWFRTPLRLLAAMKFVRGTPLDIFGLSAHRRTERAMVEWYKELIRRTVEALREDNVKTALEIASLPDQIRGYESIKDQSIATVKQLAEEKLSAMCKSNLVQVG
jgi:indolepyruvate ferredoxin oxidoreductase